MSARLVPLLDFVPKATPRFQRPSHLAPVAALLDRARHEEVRAVVSAPPRMGKTELLQHAIVWRLLDEPSTRIGYAAYGQRFAEKKSARMRKLAERVGITLDRDSASKADWRTGRDEGGVWATSVGGPITGEGFDLLVIDDPVKGRAVAESQVERDKVDEWFRDDASTRLEPEGSCIVFMARWHEDDLAGRLIREGWEHVVLPAIDADGLSLWPERWSVERLRERQTRLGDYSWASLYMGQPFARGGALFKDVHFYDELPAGLQKAMREGKARLGKGIDLAYSAKTRADRSAAVVMVQWEDTFYVVEVRTAQVRVPEFLRVLHELDGKYSGRWHWYTSTTERGLADLATDTSAVAIDAELATADKFVRAQGVSAAWNAGRVLLPRKAPWLDTFVAEVCGFTGVGDRRDDQVDALASAFARIGWGTLRQRQGATIIYPRESFYGNAARIVRGRGRTRPDYSSSNSRVRQIGDDR